MFPNVFRRCSQSTRDEVIREIQGERELKIFLDDPNSSVLCVRSLPGGSFRLTNALEKGVIDRNKIAKSWISSA